MSIQYDTYRITAPAETHTRPATCKEVECPNWANGWVTRVDVSTALGQAQAKYIVEKSDRRFVETTRGKEGAFREYRFHAGQECFTQHRVSLERPANYLRQPGKLISTGTTQVFSRPEDWRDEMGENLDRLADLQRRG